MRSSGILGVCQNRANRL
ncbi:TPR protein [Caballeronia sordidicola]|uniref:TPR protein n=1 Tax=Caballeronia sordidicola TaxID=196367 RepID=A0A242MPV9_CABSO|nr:TPR protein [Caballeronia sordidicola]